jgi:predicted dehydrogenase
LGTLASIWHDNLARPSLRRVEIFCSHRHIVIEGDDWYGPVSWTDSDGQEKSLGGGELSEAVAPMRDGAENPDGQFVRAVVAGTPATPDFADAVKAHRVVDAMYRSALSDGATVEIGRG